MVAYMEEALKNKLGGFEDQEKVSKLFSICSINKDHSREQIGREKWRSPCPYLASRLLLRKFWKSTPYCVEANLHAIEDSQHYLCKTKDTWLTLVKNWPVWH
ncbi:hypothetical protein M9H77_07216 [Catharanthus roseus]|uniref:Uncharacterized protein n=1 Tax=Catharanthus roseus TaxID=4058 RepID=A0ACC0BUF2_CATRO|nr:hypothetical protein M9H77_07216 [Catharanthus roseus]